MIDPVCLIHGLKKSEHVCLYCCLCYRTLIGDECHAGYDGRRQDICHRCARIEELMMGYDPTNLTHDLALVKYYADEVRLQLRLAGERTGVREEYWDFWFNIGV